MENKSNRLGKGLDALIPTIAPNTTSIIEHIPVELITRNPYQPRKTFEQHALESLANSIKIHGLAQPIIVRKTAENYELVVGERRLAAIKLGGYSTIPAIIKDISNKTSCEMALVENIDRENLNIVEIAYSLKRLMSEFNYTQESLSELFSRSRSSITNILRLLKLPSPILNLLAKKKLTEGHARTLIEFGHNTALCEQLANEIMSKNLSVRQAERLAKNTTKPVQSKNKSQNLFDHHIKTLSKKFNTPIEIKHTKNKLTLSISCTRFKDYIEFLDTLCKIPD